MAELFTNFSISEIILCVIGIVVAIKWTINIKNTFKQEIDKFIKAKEDKDHLYAELKRRSNIQDRIEESVDKMIETIKMIDERINKNTEKLNDVYTVSEQMKNSMKNLTEADKVIIKAHISEKRKQALQDGYITQYDLEICEKMLECYQASNGNQKYINKFMEELRALPDKKKE